ncbi:galectin-5-like [Megalobrama amblycephala]|uniref:galectin-5-like n=1 Tax=Megalobrama amblycephala TaxID=75352 RepID=UPI002014798D|nr:galectin-5-like [Megalobrama amblycephala]
MALHQQPQFFKPMLPYKSIIHGGLQPGKAIIAQGIIDSQANSIEFNLHHKFGIAFHYKPRFDQNVVVRNTFGHGKWDDVEERSGPMPFKRGQMFLVTILCSCDHYKVFFNGEETHTYKHRFTNLGEIDVLEVSGDMELTFAQP